MVTSKYAIRRSYPLFLYGFAVLSAALVGLVAFVPACNPDDWWWGVADVAMFAGASAFLVWHAWRMSRITFEVTDDALIERDGVHIKRELQLSGVDYLKNRPRRHVIEVGSRAGKPIQIPYQVSGIDDLVDLLVAKIGKPLQHPSWRPNSR